MLSEVGFDVVSCLSYGAVSLALMVLGVWLVDLLTPGKLVDLIWRDRRIAPAIHVSTAMLAMALIIQQAIRASADQLVAGLISTVVYGVLGLVLMAISFWVIDLITPGRLGELMVAEGIHPAAWVTGVSNLAVGLVIAAVIS